MLLTRSPLSAGANTDFSFDLHVLGTPPAFVLSQDQTLHQDLTMAEAIRSIGLLTPIRPLRGADESRG